MPEKPSDLVNHNCLIYTDSGAADRWPIFSTDSEMSLHGNFQTNSVSALRSAAENGQGIVVMPQFAAARSLAAGRLIPLLQQYTTVKKPITVIYPHRGLVPTKTTVFVDMLTKHIPKALAAVPCPPQPVQDDGVLVEAHSIRMGGSIESVSRAGIDHRPPPSTGLNLSRRRRGGVEAAQG
jgi:hypothetical protein